MAQAHLPVAIDVQHLHHHGVTLLADVFSPLDPTVSQFGDVHHPFHARFQLDEGSEFRGADHLGLDQAVGLVLVLHSDPRVAAGLFDRQQNPVALRLDLQDAYVGDVADLEHVARLVDPTPA